MPVYRQPLEPCWVRAVKRLVEMEGVKVSNKKLGGESYEKDIYFRNNCWSDMFWFGG